VATRQSTIDAAKQHAEIMDKASTELDTRIKSTEDKIDARFEKTEQVLFNIRDNLIRVMDRQEIKPKRME
jgi:hypothetical protein